MRKLLIVPFLLILFTACTKQKVIDTGVADPHFKGSIMAYLRSDNYNWELTVQMIEHAGLADLFEGKVDTMPSITFWAPKSYSIFRFIMDSQRPGGTDPVYLKVTDIPPDVCREYILRHVVKGKYLKSSISYRNTDYYIGSPQQNGGTNFTTVAGNQIRAYLEGSPYGGVPDAGPVTLNLFSVTMSIIIPMATPDIQPDNGVIHALNYNYDFPKI